MTSISIKSNSANGRGCFAPQRCLAFSIRNSDKRFRVFSFSRMGCESRRSRYLPAAGTWMERPRSLADNALLYLSQQKLSRFGDALRKQMAKIGPPRPNAPGVANPFSCQLPNIKWLISAHCDLGDALTDLDTRLRAFPGGLLLDNFLAALAQARQPVDFHPAICTWCRTLDIGAHHV